MAPVPRLTWHHCWWTVLHSALPPDSVAIRFQRGSALAGLTGGKRTRSADTAWASAGPTPLDGSPQGTIYASRAVAYWRGDSSVFRYYVGIGPPARGSLAQPFDSTAMTGRVIGLCDEIARGADIRWSRPRRNPNAEDSLTVWLRVP